MTEDDLSIFAADWLALREPADERARSARLVEAADHWLRNNGAEPVQITDLGAGTGANLRYLAPRLGVDQNWTLIDHDRALLERTLQSNIELSRDHTVTVTTEVADLESCLTGLPRNGLVTAAALLDLVTTDWITRLAQACCEARSAVLFALSVDRAMHLIDDRQSAGAVAEAANDQWVLGLVASHQRRNKGMGQALGPDAPGIVRQELLAAGFQVFTAMTPWRLAVDESALASAAIDEWAKAAVAEQPSARGDILRWAERRRADAQHGRCRLEIGHQDVLALPDDARVDAISRSNNISGATE